MPDVRRVYPSLWITALFAAVSLVGHAQQAPAGQFTGPAAQAPAPGSAGAASAPVTPTPTAVIFGRVIDAATGRPLAGALVQLDVPSARVPSATPAAPTLPTTPALTNGQGQFLFQSLPAGRYMIGVQIGGYLAGSYGQSRFDGPSGMVKLGEGQRLTDVTIRMWKHGAITGRVLDEAGEPSVGLMVRSLRRSLVAGQSQWTATGTGTTDDRGIYRIGSLQPGEYLVATTAGVATVPVSTSEAYTEAMRSGGSAPPPPIFQEASASPVGMGSRVGDFQLQPLRNTLPPPPASPDQVLAYETVFHPSATRLADAVRIRVGSGEERTGIDLQAKLSRTFRVSGRVTGPDGQPLSAGLTLVPADVRDLSMDYNFEAATAVAAADGRFTFLGVPAGQYAIKMIRPPRLTSAGPSVMTTISMPGGSIGFVTSSGSDLGQGPPPTAAIDEPTLWAEVPVTVAGSVEDVAVVVRTGARVRGTVAFEGPGPLPQPRQRQQMGFTLVPVSGRGGLRQPPPGRLAGDDTFATSQYAPGRYFVNVTSPGAPWTVQSVTVAGRNALEEPFDLGGSDVDNVVVKFTSRATTLSGTVRSATSPAPDATVAVFPADHQRWIANGMRATRTRTLATSADGSFELSGLLPGAYLAVALAAGAPLDLQDPATIEALARAGVSVTLGEGETRSISLTVTSTR